MNYTAEIRCLYRTEGCRSVLTWDTSFGLPDQTEYRLGAAGWRTESGRRVCPNHPANALDPLAGAGIKDWALWELELLG